MKFRNVAGLVRSKGVRVILAAVICLMSCSPLLADSFILRCDAPKGGISFSVAIDPITHSVRVTDIALEISGARQRVESPLAAAN